MSMEAATGVIAAAAGARMYTLLDIRRVERLINAKIADVGDRLGKSEDEIAYVQRTADAVLDGYLGESKDSGEITTIEALEQHMESTIEVAFDRLAAVQAARPELDLDELEEFYEDGEDEGMGDPSDASIDDVEGFAGEPQEVHMSLDEFLALLNRGK